MNQDSGWRKRQIALDIKAENARELGLNYEPNKTVIEMAIKAGAIPIHKDYKQRALVGNENLERFAELVRADERKSWSLEMEAMERQVNILTDALAQEREACAKVCDEADKDSDWPTAANCAAVIRARSNT